MRDNLRMSNLSLQPVSTDAAASRARAHALRTGLLCYGLWAINAALGLLTVLELRNTLLWFAITARMDPYRLSAIDGWTFVVLGLLWLGWVLVMESVYRIALRRGLAKLWPLVIRTTVPLVVLIAACAIITRFG